MEDTKTIQQQYNELYSNYMDAQSVITNLNEIIGIADLHPKSIYIQKLSITTCIEDINHFKKQDLPSQVPLGTWRVKIGKSGEWAYVNSIIGVLNHLNRTIGND